MCWLMQWVGRKSQLSLQHQQRLASWKALSDAALNVPIADTRCVVVDVETSGLNLMKDRLISIGAVAMVNGRIALGDSFCVILQQQVASKKGNILLHGIGATAQLEGELPADGLLAFLDYLKKSPIIAFHVAFDETMIRRALHKYLNLSFRHPWLDLAHVMPGLNPSMARNCHSLDDWIGYFGINIVERHNALADALATAQLFQIACAQAHKEGIHDYAGLRSLEKAQRWLSST